jgi:hypothetical protein
VEKSHQIHFAHGRYPLHRVQWVGLQEAAEMQ